MSDYDLAKQVMAHRMQQADNWRLRQNIKPAETKPNRLLAFLRRSQSASVSSEKVAGVPAHQLTPSGTL